MRERGTGGGAEAEGGGGEDEGGLLDGVHTGKSSGEGGTEPVHSTDGADGVGRGDRPRAHGGEGAGPVRARADGIVTRAARKGPAALRS
ncbi:hypothetical protein HEK616_16850 [Streptomyces nigrescens]|uniref:Pr1-like protein n=1 Tax=Streptomyces nigrescens TaxID=1920 RepID=A0ABM7ZPC6_STRNI|nr:hypothetical protein HEK616_16850 [Streptomyces nigrescens]